MSDFNVKPINTRATLPGDHYEATVEVAGIEQSVVVGYKPIEGYQGNMEEPGVPDYVEITSVMLDLNNDLIEIETSAEWDESMADEIQEWIDSRR